MRTLHFIISGQDLSKSGDFFNIVRGTKGYLRCQFAFGGTDWIGCKAVAIFEAKKKEYPVVIDRNGSCMIPNQVTDYDIIKLRIVGAKNNYRITTNKILISQEG